MARVSRLNWLRLTFMALGLLLLLPLYVLKAAMDRRIAAQARLRHEVVAERIFDEFERELTRVLERESMRPSSAYDATTDPGAWAPFVLGYFTFDSTGSRFAPSNSLDGARRSGIEDRLANLRSMPAAAAGSAPAPTERPDALDVWKNARPAAKMQPSRSSPAVLHQLNVGSERKSLNAPRNKKSSADPMQDYAF